jgi:zinc protease
VHGASLYLDIAIASLDRLINVGQYSEPSVERWQPTTRAMYEHKRAYQRLELERQQLAAIYGPEHPYARTGVIVPAAIDTIGADELQSFPEQHYTAANATLVIAGNSTSPMLSR